jgi:hypothetical protein
MQFEGFFSLSSLYPLPCILSSPYLLITSILAIPPPRDLLTLHHSSVCFPRVHFHILELFYDINLMMLATSGIPIHRGSTLYDMITSQSNMSPQPFGAPPGFMGSSAPPNPVIPMSSLQSIGLHSDVVTRLRELQSYLNQVPRESPSSPHHGTRAS